MASGGGFRYGVGLLWWLAELWHGRVRIKAQTEDSNGEERERESHREESNEEGIESHREKRVKLTVFRDELVFRD